MTLNLPPGLTLAVIVPCYNEAAAIEKVVRDFRQHLPMATVYVYDNNSTDGTPEIAAAAGAIVRREPLQGKGNVMRRMFSDVEADIYVLADGDDTYDASAAPELVQLMLDSGCDFVNGQRVTDIQAAYRTGHRFGNWMLTTMVGQLFGTRCADMLSGYRIMSRRFVKSFPALSGGFDIEPELVVHGLQLRVPMEERPTRYKDRPQGSVSKLNTIRDGFRVLWAILRLAMAERPVLVFGSLAALLMLLSIGLGIPVVATYFETGLVPRLPTAVLATGIMLVGVLSLACGLILDTVTLGRREMRRLAYLRYPSIAAVVERFQNKA
jgi:glycosyltransferase involved in cell wall biosynthesis